MPPRAITLAIVVLWLAVTSFFLYQEVGQTTRGGEPLVYPITLVDEAGEQAEDTRWQVLKNGFDAYVGFTEWRYDPKEDIFQTNCRLSRRYAEEPPQPKEHPYPFHVQNINMDSKYWFSRNGSISQLKVETSLELHSPGKKESPWDTRTQIEGEPKKDRFLPQVAFFFTLTSAQKGYFLKLPPDKSFQGDPIKLSPRGLVFNPLHPWRRVQNLKEGQTWPLPVIDPLMVGSLLESLGQAGPNSSPPQLSGELVARALPDIHNLSWEHKLIPCRLIEARGEDFPEVSLKVWARVEDGTVFRQEARLWGDTWDFVRCPEWYKMGLPKAPWPKKP